MKQYLDEKVVKVMEKVMEDMAKDPQDPATYQKMMGKLSVCGTVIEILTRIAAKDKMMKEMNDAK